VAFAEGKHEGYRMAVAIHKEIRVEWVAEAIAAAAGMVAIVDQLLTYAPKDVEPFIRHIPMVKAKADWDAFAEPK